MINTIVDDRQHAPNNLTNYYMIYLIQPYHPLCLQQGITHTWMGGTWRDDGVAMVMTMPTNSPHRRQNNLQISSPEEVQRWRRLRNGKMEYGHLLQGFLNGSKNKSQSGASGEVPTVQAT